jgi:hypothetical protein
MFRKIVSLACVACLGAAVTAAGCSSSSSGGSTPGQSIGAAGGSFTTADGSGVSIPAGALPAGSSVEVTVAVDPNAPTPPSAWIAVGSTYLVGPEGQQFSQPVTVTIAFDPARLPTGRTAHDISVLTSPATGTPSYGPLTTTEVDSTRVSASTTHFSYFMAVVPNGVGNVDAGSDGSSDTGSEASAMDGSQDSTTADAPPNGDGGSDAGSDAASDGGADSDSGPPDTGPDALVTNPFVGTWSCTFTVTDAEPDGGSSTGSATVVVTPADGGGEITATASSCTTDGGPVVFTASTSGNTATLNANQPPCNGTTYENGTGIFTVSGGTLSFTGTLAPWEGGTAPQYVTESCTRDDAGAGDASPACSQPPNPAPSFQATLSCATPPTPAGGTLVDGTYYQASDVQYPDAGCTGTRGTSQGTLVISGGTITAVQAAGGWWLVGTSTTSGTSLDIACACGTLCNDGGGVATGPFQYTATSTMLTIFSNPSAYDVSTWAKQ